jgi:hypothetical protein
MLEKCMWHWVKDVMVRSFKELPSYDLWDLC